MSRKRSENDDQDSLELLLDTVSNVFGGVMFLTLLAALLIISRGTAPTEPVIEAVPDATVDSTALVDAKIRQVQAAIKAQQRTRQQLDQDGTLKAQTDRLRSLDQTLSLARRHASRTESSKAKELKALQDQLAKESENESQIDQIKREVSERMKRVNAIRSDTERTVEFRPLNLSMTDEAVIILRYGRWYMLENGPGEGINRNDFFVLKKSGVMTRVTPKPHCGTEVNRQTLGELTSQLNRKYATGQFHVLIAVWDDSFYEFNAVKDAVKAAGYNYRTLPCDSSTRLTNQFAAESYVQ
ncbi:MAG: hypothetical protein KDB00_22245 [Planctomycetales bacterium]|nr:hypothetical protein [Planctomycetales bacterium]